MVSDDKDKSMEGKVASLRSHLWRKGAATHPQSSKIYGVEFKGYSLDTLIEVSIVIFHFYTYHKQ